MWSDLFRETSRVRAGVELRGLFRARIVLRLLRVLGHGSPPRMSIATCAADCDYIRSPLFGAGGGQLFRRRDVVGQSPGRALPTPAEQPRCSMRRQAAEAFSLSITPKMTNPVGAGFVGALALPSLLSLIECKAMAEFVSPIREAI